MHVLLIIIGLLFMLFGGGCTLIIVGLAASDPGSLVHDPSALGLLVFLGLLPLGIGWLLFRWGMKIDKRKRQATVLPPRQDGGT